MSLKFFVAAWLILTLAALAHGDTFQVDGKTFHTKPEVVRYLLKNGEKKPVVQTRTVMLTEKLTFKVMREKRNAD